MGCLLEFFVEFFVEGLIELIVYLYVKIASWIVPEHKFSEKLQKRFRIGILVLFVLQVISLIVGLIILEEEDPSFALAGRYLTYIPLVMIGTQLLLGIIAKIVTVIRNKRKERDESEK